MNSGEIVYSITAGIKENCHYTANFRLVGDHGVVQAWRLNFSELPDEFFFKDSSVMQQCDL